MSDRNSTETMDEPVDDDYETVDYDENPSEQGKWLSAIIALGGLWLIVEAWVFDVTQVSFWNGMLVGIALVALGGYNYYRRNNEELGSTAAAALSALLGLWLIAAPFLLSGGVATDTSPVTFWTDVIVGLVVFLLGAYSAYESRDAEAPAAATR